MRVWSLWGGGGEEGASCLCLAVCSESGPFVPLHKVRDGFFCDFAARTSKLEREQKRSFETKKGLRECSGSRNFELECTSTTNATRKLHLIGAIHYLGFIDQMAEILQLIDEIQAEHKSLTDELEQTSKEIDKLDRNTAAILNDIRSANEHNVLIKAEISELRQESQKLRSREECMKVVQDNLMLEIDKATTATTQHRSEMQRGMKSFISASRPLQDRVKKSCSFGNNAQNNLTVRRSPHEHERTLGLATAQTSSLSAAEAEISRLCADLRTQHSLRRGEIPSLRYMYIA